MVEVTKCFVVLIVVGVLSTGTFNSIALKVQFTVVVKAYSNFSANDTQTPHPFNKAWWQTYLMFIGELLCFFGYLICRNVVKHRFKTVEVFEEEGWRESQFSNRVFSWVFILPVICDTASSTMLSIALLYIDASVWQMLRGSTIIFAGILQTIFLKRKLPCFKWLGMLVVVLGLVLVSVASAFKHNTSLFTSGPGQAALGVGLVLLGSLCPSTQMIIEEVFLKKRNYHPLYVVGMKCVYGRILIGGAIMPAVHHIPGPETKNRDK